MMSMNRKTSWDILGFSLLISYVLGHGLHWFIGGAAQVHSPARNLAVVGQILVAAILLLWALHAAYRHRKNGQSPSRE
jgi:membrane protein implicated in regulation of membrane protease activity